MKYLSEYMNDQQTELFNKLGVFFAFGQDQFNERRQPGVTYISLGAGLICPKHNADALEKGLDKIHTEAIRQDVNENGADAIIEREYWNHETQITMNDTDARRALDGHIKHFPGLFTPERIKQVMNQCYALAVENDLF